MYPTIRLEIEGVKHAMIYHFSSFSKDLEEVVKNALEKICTEEYVQGFVYMEIEKLIPELIHSALHHPELKSKLTDSIIKEFTGNAKRGVANES